MEILELISKIITVIHRGFDIVETFLKVANGKDICNDTLKNNIDNKTKS
jgi:hypothetical protein